LDRRPLIAKYATMWGFSGGRRFGGAGFAGIVYRALAGDGSRRRHTQGRRGRLRLVLYNTPHAMLRAFPANEVAVKHTIQDKTRLLQRVRRLRGQVEAIERALLRDADCARVMQLTVSVRGAANGLMAELLEDHIRLHVSDPARDRDRTRARGAKHLIEVVHAYLR
jgi:DNA-binding FrmR family transcriptional regulator